MIDTRIILGVQIIYNPPFSMNYSSSNEDEKRILLQHKLTENLSSAKSSILFLNRYLELLVDGGELLIVLDDTVINGKSFEEVRKWMLENFIVLGVHSLPFNAFFKAKANIKTSILHLRKKRSVTEKQSDVFMSISNNIGHDNSLKDTPFRNNLSEILISYLEWQRTGEISATIRKNCDKSENLECPQQYWITSAQNFSVERFDAFFYCPDLLTNVYEHINLLRSQNRLDVLSADRLMRRSKLSKEEKMLLNHSEARYRYIEIGDVTQYGLITKYIEGSFADFPTRAEYQIHTGDILLALNNSSRGTVVLVPKEFDNAFCTSGFLVIVPENVEQGLLLWYALRGELCRKQIYYLAQTASQPELKIDAWNKYFKIPMPIDEQKQEALKRAKKFYKHLTQLSNIDYYSFNV